MRQVFLDLDGCIADFDRAVLCLSGQTAQQLGDTALFRLIASVPGFWRDLPLMGDARDLLNVVLPYRPTIITGCPSTGFEQAATEKRQWVERNLGSLPVITCRSKDKQMHMKAEGDVLIDDWIKNIHRWEDAGGLAIHHTSAATTIPHFLDAMSRRP